MKIAISSTGPALDAEIDPRFGRCQYFMIIDLDDMSFEAVANPNISLGSGAGIQSAKLVVDKGAKTVITGRCGPKAQQVLSTTGLEVIVGISGTVRNAAERYKEGQLTPEEAPQAVPSGVMGRGMGKGPRGGGAGRGRGRMGGFGGGPGGNCVCPNCGEKVPHIAGRPCYDEKCPKCGTPMRRE